MLLLIFICIFVIIFLFLSKKSSIFEKIIIYEAQDHIYV